MKQRKRVLITSDAGATVARDALLLELRVRRYTVLESVTSGEPEPDAVVTVYASMEHITGLLNQHWPARVIALVRSDAERRQALTASAHRTASDMTEVREVLRQICARRRGLKSEVIGDKQEHTVGADK